MKFILAFVTSITFCLTLFGQSTPQPPPQNSPERQASLQWAQKVYPDLTDPNSQLFKTVQRLTLDAQNNLNSPNHAEFYKPDAPKFFATLAAVALGIPVVSDDAKPAPGVNATAGPAAASMPASPSAIAAEVMKAQTFPQPRFFKLDSASTGFVLDGTGNRFNFEKNLYMPVVRVMTRNELDQPSQDALIKTDFYLVAPFAHGHWAIIPDFGGSFIPDTEITAQIKADFAALANYYVASQQKAQASAPAATPFFNDPKWESSLDKSRDQARAGEKQQAADKHALEMEKAANPPVYYVVPGY